METGAVMMFVDPIDIVAIVGIVFLIGIAAGISIEQNNRRPPAEPFESQLPTAIMRDLRKGRADISEALRRSNGHA